MFFLSLDEHVCEVAKKFKLIFVLMTLLMIWHSWFFLVGYRLTSDEVSFTYISLQGPKKVFEAARDFAEGSGRIGSLYLMPINIYSAQKSEFLAWRLLFVVLYMLTVWLIFVYSARVMKIAIAPLAFLVFLALHPLAFEHLPPTSFPMQNTLPFLVLISSRLSERLFGERGVWLMLCRLLQILAMLSTEYALLLGVVMMSAETFSRLPLRVYKFLDWSGEVLQDRRFWVDLTTFISVIGPYIAYRLIYPSAYDGNTMDGIGNFDALVNTTLRHITDGLILPRLQLQFLHAPPLIWLGTILSAYIMYVSMRIVLCHANDKITSIGAAVFFLFGAMILVVLPVAASIKQQSWCSGSDPCAFLDSRTTILGIALIISLVVMRLLSWSSGSRFQNVLRKITSGLTAIIFALGSLHNWHISQKMMASASVWEGAQTLACVPNLAPVEPEQLSRLIDPDNTIRFHTFDSPESFWPLYLDTSRSRTNCEKTEILQRSLMRAYLPLLVPGQLQLVGGDQGGIYLGDGWSNLETWGVWSDGYEAELLISPDGLEAGEVATLALDANVFIDQYVNSQRLIITQNGHRIWEGLLGETERVFAIMVPLMPHDLAQDIIRINFSLPDAHAPQVGGDPRTLGIGLRGIMLLRP